MVGNYSHLLPGDSPRAGEVFITYLHSWSDGSTRAALSRVLFGTSAFALCVRWTAPKLELGYNPSTLANFVAEVTSEVFAHQREFQKYRKLAEREKVGFGIFGEVHVEGFKNMFLNHCEGGGGHVAFRLVELFASAEEADREFGHILLSTSLLLNGLSSETGEYREYCLLPGVPYTDAKREGGGRWDSWNIEPDYDELPF